LDFKLHHFALISHDLTPDEPQLRRLVGDPTLRLSE